MDDKEIVSAMRASLADKVGRERFELWFGPTTRLVVRGGTLRVELPNRFAQDWVRSHFRREIEAACTEAAGKPLAVEFGIDAALGQVPLPGGARRRNCGETHRGGMQHGPLDCWRARAATRLEASSPCTPVRPSSPQAVPSSTGESGEKQCRRTIRNRRPESRLRQAPVCFARRLYRRLLEPFGSCFGPNGGRTAGPLCRRCWSRPDRRRQDALAGRHLVLSPQAAGPGFTPSISRPSSSPPIFSKPCTAAACPTFAASIGAWNC